MLYRLIEVFLALNVLFLLGTSIWFRLDHATSAERFMDSAPYNIDQQSLIDEIQWQYSLRSNLLLFCCTTVTYLLYIGHFGFVLLLFAVFSLVNIVTDFVYQYNSAPLFKKVKAGHQIAAGIIWIVALSYWKCNKKQTLKKN